MKRVKKWLKKNTSSLLIGLLLLSVIGGLYFFQVNALTGGLSPTENTYVTSALDNSRTLDNPLFITHKTVISLFDMAGVNGISRYISAATALIVLFSFYSIAKQWQTRRIAVAATLLLASSSWMLGIGRSALPLVLYLSWVPILALLYWMVKSKKGLTLLYFWALAFSFSFYVPGMLWFVAVLAYTQKKRLLGLFTSSPKEHIIISWLLFVVFLMPFFMLLVTSPLNALAALGLPNSLTQITGAPREFVYSLFDIFFYGREQPLFRLGHLPYLDIVSLFLFAIGLYKVRYSTSTKMLKIISIILGGWVLGISFGAVNTAVLLPVFYFVIGSGLSFVLLQWLVVFPLNPYARAVGLIITYGLVATVLVQHVNRYFIAWPQNPQTHAVFSKVDDRIE